MIPTRSIIDSISNKTVWEASMRPSDIDPGKYIKAPAGRVRWAKPGTARVTGKIADSLSPLITRMSRLFRK